MYRPLSLFIGFRYVYGKNADRFGRFVSWLSMIGLTLGSIALIVVLSVMNGLEREMQKSILDFIPQVQITSPNNTLDPTQYPADRFKDLEQVQSVTSLVTGEVILESASSLTVTTLLGIDPSNSNDPIQRHLFFGDFSGLVAGQYNLVIGRTLADQLNVGPGDKIRVMSTQASQITPIGRIPSQRLFTITGIFSVNSDINKALIYVHQDDAARLMRYPQGTITSWRLFVNNPLDIEEITAQKLPDNLIFKDWREQRGELFQAVKMEKNMIALIISLIIIVAVFNIITSLGLLVMEKQGEVAILKTQGLTQRSIMSIFIVQGASAGIIGTVLGSAIGITVALYLNDIMSFLGLSLSGIYLPSLVDLGQVITIVLSLITVSILATLYPAWQAAKTHPAEALRYE
ncbi:lipoprotein-releasing ABC transporter permease subunit LolC [Zophobihabitans entericus]|uniref:Lipoprotein-releasing ABC transporter permease subunit LolC n=1 Tax=Zophobihabitans entericus TaxID=1635327 RepID=A0A6G9ICY5_9GAMM|nr:lipoprotein-releasing ABC transporter permease subunit LolC [Zophobihabitans entericus]QIQ22083.1 lipoprotein-releasing ABC transporter permease subunit LolC [Zophobihabitans entericus]